MGQIIFTKDNYVVYIDISDLADEPPKDVIDHALENSWGVFQSERETKEFVIPIQCRKCRF